MVVQSFVFRLCEGKESVKHIPLKDLWIAQSKGLVANFGFTNTYDGRDHSSVWVDKLALPIL